MLLSSHFANNYPFQKEEVYLMKKALPFVSLLLFLLFIPHRAEAAAILQEIKDIIKTEYIGEIRGNPDQAASIEEVMNMLDPYSNYYSAETFNYYFNLLDMKQIGIGVVIEQHDQGLLVTNVFEHGSAFEQGLEAGDIITKVDSVPLRGKSLEEGHALLLGDENTMVTLEILKANGTTLVKTLTRKPFYLPNATGRLLYGNIGYIQLQSFSADAADLIRKQYEKLKRLGASSFILDLQNNGGGYVQSAEEVIALFRDAKHAYRVKYSEANTEYYLHYGPEKSKYQLHPDGTLLVNLPDTVQPIFDRSTKILVNRYSASASEMTAAAAKDYDAAVIYGENTFGKSTMQGFYPLSDGSYLKLTIGEFFGPKGTMIRASGVTPDIQTGSNPIYQAHYDAIAEQLVAYREMRALTGVPTNNTFKITLNRPPGTLNENDVELVALGGKKVDVALSKNGNQLFVTPKRPLNPGSEYMLIIHPTLKDRQNRPLEKGAYMRVTVKNQ